MATELEIYMLGLVNAERQKAGVPLLKIAEELSVSARNHTEWMNSTNTLSHTGADGTHPSNRVAAAGYGIKDAVVGENIYMCDHTGALDHVVVDRIIKGWMDEPGHRAAMLSTLYTEVGFGIVQGRYRGIFSYDKEIDAAWATMDLSKPNAVQAIPGSYECHVYDNGGKNDWHYVTVSKISSTVLRWTNRAGVSWTLSTTPDKSKLAVGSECPYFKDYGYKEAGIVWVGDTVQAILGPSPWNEPYQKS